MPTIVPVATHIRPSLPFEPPASPRFETWLPTLLSVVAGMVDLISFLSLGIFTAHITGNIVVIGALVARHGRVNLVQILSIPVFIVAVAATWLLAKASRDGLSVRSLALDLAGCAFDGRHDRKSDECRAVACGREFANPAVHDGRHGAAEGVSPSAHWLFRRLRGGRGCSFDAGRMGLVISRRARGSNLDAG